MGKLLQDVLGSSLPFVEKLLHDCHKRTDNKSHLCPLPFRGVRVCNCCVRICFCRQGGRFFLSQLENNKQRATIAALLENLDLLLALLSTIAIKPTYPTSSNGSGGAL